MNTYKTALQTAAGLILLLISAAASAQRSPDAIKCSRLYCSQADSLFELGYTLSSEGEVYRCACTDFEGANCSVATWINVSNKVSRPPITVYPRMVTFYRAVGFIGACQPFGDKTEISSLPEPDASAKRTLTRIFNDEISSVMVPRGFHVWIYKDADFQGESRKLTEDCADLGPDWSGKISSFRILLSKCN